MRPAPLPVRDGLGPARVRLHGGPVLAELTARFGAPARAKVLAGEVVDVDGTVVDDATVLPAGASIYLYRELPGEVAVPFDIPVLSLCDTPGNMVGPEAERTALTVIAKVDHRS